MFWTPSKLTVTSSLKFREPSKPLPQPLQFNGLRATKMTPQTFPTLSFSPGSTLIATPAQRLTSVATSLMSHLHLPFFHYERWSVFRDGLKITTKLPVAIFESYTARISLDYLHCKFQWLSPTIKQIAW